MTLRAFRLRRPVGLAAAFVLVALEGCSLFFELNTTQCEVTQDCRNLGPQFATTVCANRVCVETKSDGSGGTTGGASPTGGRAGGSGTGGEVEGGAAGSTSEGGSSGTTNGGMPGTGGRNSGGTNSGGTAGTGGIVEPPECVTNSDCIDAHAQQAYICKDSKCLKLTDPNVCPIILPKSKTLEMLSEPSPIILGGFATILNKGDPSNTQAAINWDLALKEFHGATGGGLPAYGGGKRRPVLTVVCNGALSDVDPAMDHLTELGVPAILSTLDPAKLGDAFDYTQTPEYAAAEKPEVFFMSTGSADLRLANLPDGGLIWHMLGDPRQLAATTAAMVRRMEPFIRAQRKANSIAVGGGFDDPDTVPLRVTIVYSDEPTMQDVATVLTAEDEEHPERTLVFNDKPCFENGTNFRQVEIQSIKNNSQPNVSAGIAELQARPPHLIIALTTEEFAGYVIPAIEGPSYWGKSGNPSYQMHRPYYVASTGMWNTIPLRSIVQNMSNLTPPLERRLVGVNWALAQGKAKSLYDQYLSRMANHYQAGSGEVPIEGTENHYDGAYSLLYGVAAANASRAAGEWDGGQVLAGIEDRVLTTRMGSTSVDIGPDKVSAAVTSLSSNQYRMSLFGTMGPPDFDTLSGTRNRETSVWCIQRGGTPTAWTYQPDGLLYQPPAAAGELGTFVDGPSGVPVCLQDYVEDPL